MTVPWPAAPAVWAVVQATTADDRKILLVVGGLVAVALALTALTIRYWRITRPVPVGEPGPVRPLVAGDAAPAAGPERAGTTSAVVHLDDLDDLDDDDIFVHTSPVPAVAPASETPAAAATDPAAAATDPAAAAPDPAAGEPSPGSGAGEDHVGVDDDWRSRATGEHPMVEARSGPGIVRPSRHQRAAALRAARTSD